MTTKPKGNSSGFRLNTAEGGIIMIGRDADDTRVAGKPDGSVFVGSAERPMLVRMPEGNVMLALNEDFFAHIMPDGQLLILSGDENLTFSPSGNVMISSTESNERASDFRLQMTLMAADLLRQEVNFTTVKARENSEGLRLVTTRSGSAQVSQGKSAISLIGRRDGAVYVGSRNQQFLGRMPSGDILFCMAEDFAALIRPTGRMTICSASDTIEFAPGTGMTLSAGENNLLASEIHDQLVLLSEEITKPVPAATRIAQPAPAPAPEPVEMVADEVIEMDVEAEPAPVLLDVVEGEAAVETPVEDEPEGVSSVTTITAPALVTDEASDGSVPEEGQSEAILEAGPAIDGSAADNAETLVEDNFSVDPGSSSPLRLVNPLLQQAPVDPSEQLPEDASDDPVTGILNAAQSGSRPDPLPATTDPVSSMLAGKKSITEDVFPENIFALR